MVLLTPANPFSIPVVHVVGNMSEDKAEATAAARRPKIHGLSPSRINQRRIFSAKSIAATNRRREDTDESKGHEDS